MGLLFAKLWNFFGNEGKLVTNLGINAQYSTHVMQELGVASKTKHFIFPPFFRTQNCDCWT